jgi:hypothetical protein
MPFYQQSYAYGMNQANGRVNHYEKGIELRSEDDHHVVGQEFDNGRVKKIHFDLPSMSYQKNNKKFRTTPHPNPRPKRRKTNPRQLKKKNGTKRVKK